MIKARNQDHQGEVRDPRRARSQVLPVQFINELEKNIQEQSE